MLKVKNPDFLDVICKNDIIFLNECWLPKNSNVDIENYSCFVKSRSKRKRAKRNSGGICLLVKNNLMNYFDFVQWSYEDGFILQSKYPCTANGKLLCCMFVYLKPSNSSRNKLVTELEDFDVLSEKLCELRANAELLVLGDLNARTSTLADIYDTSSLSNNYYSPDFFDTNNFLTIEDFTSDNMSFLRKNKDNKTNDYGHKLVNLCKKSGLAICNGRVRGDFDGEFTYIDKKGKSAIDYALASKGLFHYLNTLFVHTPTVFSDHNPLTLNLKNILFENHMNTNTHNDKKYSSSSYRWFHEKSEDIFLSNMNDDYSVDSLKCIIDILKTDFNDHDIIDECTNAMNNVITHAALSFKNDASSKTNAKPFNNNNSQPWYDNECKLKRKYFDTALFTYKDTPSFENLNNLTFIRNSYRKLCRKKTVNIYHNNLWI